MGKSLYIYVGLIAYLPVWYVISVRLIEVFSTAFFKFHFTMDTFAVQMYISLLPKYIRNFYPLKYIHGTQAKSGYAVFYDISTFS